ncbi:MAG: ribonuclease H [Planctomycetota bacterium]
MPSFSCHVCGSTFQVPEKVLAKYPGWKPKACRVHRDAKGKGGGAGASAQGAPGAQPGLIRARAARPRPAAPAAAVASGTRAATMHGHSPESGVFTDGSASPNPGPGGWGLVWVKDGQVLAEQKGHDPATTNNRMELTALIAAYELLPEDAAVTVYSDSRLCVDTITKWAPNWEKKGWRKPNGEIKNLELVQRLFALARAHPNVRLEWIAAHVGHRWNEHADGLATAWMKDRRR